MERGHTRLGRWIIVAAIAVASALPIASAGPIIISGMDPEDHGAPGVQMISDIMHFVVSESTIYIAQNRPSPTKILQLGGTGGPIGFSMTDAAVIASNLGYTLTVVSGMNILSVDFSEYDAIYMPTCSINLFPPSGGLSAIDLMFINQRVNDFIAFVNAGGGIAAFAQNDVGGYGWFPLGGIQTVNLGESGQGGLTVTAEGLEILSPSATAVEPFHQAFIGPAGLFGLEVLAHESFGLMRPLLIGGPGNTCIGQLLLLEPATSTGAPCSPHTVTATASRSVFPCGPNAGVTVDFSVVGGPNSGVTGNGVTNAAGQATFTYSGAGGPGTDQIQASYFDIDTGQTHVSNVVTRTWTAGQDPVIDQGAALPQSVNTNSTCPGAANEITLSATDPDGPATALTWSVHTAPATGTVTLVGGNTGGTVSVCYAPNANQGAPDSYVIKVADACGGQDTITINVTVQNAPPVIAGPDPAPLVVLKNSACPNPNNRLNLTATDPDGDPALLAWTIIQQPATGAAMFLGTQSGPQVTVCYSPQPDQSAPDSFVVQVTDQNGLTDTVTVAVTVVNQPPVIAQPNPYSLTVNKNSVCPNPNNRITLNANDVDGNNAVLNWQIVTPPSTGQAIFLGANVGPQVIVCYQPDANQIAADSFVVQVTDDGGATATITINITIHNDPPAITQGPNAGISVQKNSTCPNAANQVALGAVDPDGDAAQMVWSISVPPATGTVSFVGSNIGPGVVVCYQPNPNQIAVDNFVVRVTDKCGGTDTISITVTVVNTPPSIAQSDPIVLTVGKNTDCAQSANQVALSADDPDGDEAALSWSVFTAPAHGVASFVGGQLGGAVVVCYTPAPDQMAADSFVILVSDDVGATDSITVNVTVTNDPPVITPAGPIDLTVGKNSSCPNAANQVNLSAVDPDGSAATLAWTIATPPANGTAAFVGGTSAGASVSVCYAPNANQIAPDSVVVRVTDDCGAIDEVTINVTVVNLPPTISPTGPLAITVQKNSVCQLAPNQVNLTADDPDGDEALLAWSLLTAPATGTVSFVGGVNTGAAVTVCYQPDPDQMAADSFEVRVDDGRGGTDTVLVDVTVLNSPPVIDQGNGPIGLPVALNSTCATTENQVNLSATDPDQPGSQLSWSITPGPANGSASFVGPATGGAVVICYQPNPNQANSDSFTVVVDDGCGGSDSITIMVTVGNMPPVITPPGPVAITVSSNSTCSDVENNVDLTADDPDADESLLTWSISTPPATGTVAFVGGVATGGAVTVCYQPNANQSAPDTFVVTVTDLQGGVDSVTINVTVVNDAPSITPVGPIDLTVQKNSTCPNAANQVDLTGDDPDGLESLLTWSVATQPATGTVSFVGGVTIGEMVSVCYQPNANQISPDSFAIRVSDPQGASALVVVNVTVNNAPPEINPAGPILLTVQNNSLCSNAANQVNLTADDPDGDEALLAWSIQVNPATGTASFVGGASGGAVTLCYQPNPSQIAPDSFVVRVDDGRGGTDDVTINVVVQNAPPEIAPAGPVSIAVQQNSTCPDAANQVALSATDPDGSAAALVWSLQTPPATGTVTFIGGATGANVMVCYQPDGDQINADSFVVQVTDDAGGIDSVAINVTVNNADPEIDQGSSVALLVQKNSLCPGENNSVALSAVDPDAAASFLSWSIYTPPATGSVSFVGPQMGGNVTVCYQPNADQMAADSFVVLVSDAHGATDTIAVNVTVFNVAPDITPAGPVMLSVGKNTMCPNVDNQVALSAVDPDGNPATLIWSVTSPPATGTVSFVNGISAGGQIQVCYQPDPNQVATDSFTVTVSDDCGGVDSVEIIVSVGNLRPEISPAGPLAIVVQWNTDCADAPNLVALTAVDPDGDAAQLSWSIQTDPATGVASFVGGNTGAAVTVCYTPNPNQTAADTFVVRVQDSNGGTATITINVTVLCPGSQADCNNNGTPDGCDIDAGTAQDCNANGIPDSCDIADGTSADCNNNGIPDECDLNPDDPDNNGQVSPDCNNNGIPDECDIANGTSPDCNNNQVPDECDIEQGEFPDCNNNGIPDSCDIAGGAAQDCNNNGIPDSCDLANGAPDCNANGIPDSCEIANGSASDCNGNGVPDACDIAGGTSQDCNHNGVPDECDINPNDPDQNGQTSGDCNHNGIPDECEIANGSLPDCNQNGVPDACDIAGGTSQDCNNNGIPDDCDVNPNDPDHNGQSSQDCNHNGVPDECEIAGGTADDCNGNGIPDECDILNGGSTGDCNNNGVPDDCDVDPTDPDGNGHTSPDCNNNGVPDECDLHTGDPDGNGSSSADCNHNGVPDECDVANGDAHDCNGNGIPDECDMAGGASPDCNGNGVPDSCDVNPNDPDGNGFTSQDCNLNGVPDECDLHTGDPDRNNEFSADCNENGIPDECDIAAGLLHDADANGIADECQEPTGQPTPDECDPDEIGLNLLASFLFRAPVCGPGCLSLIPFGLLGMAVMKSGYRRGRRWSRRSREA